MAERGSGSTRDPLEAVVTPLVIRPSVRRILYRTVRVDLVPRSRNLTKKTSHRKDLVYTLRAIAYFSTGSFSKRTVAFEAVIFPG